MKRFLVALWLLFTFSAQVMADEILVGSSVRLPDKKPAVGASVLIHQTGSGGKGRDVRVKTTENGYFSATLENQNDFFPFPDNFVIINLPGYALSILPLKDIGSDWWTPPTMLVPNSPIQGQVLSADGEPVADAQLCITPILPDSFSHGRTFSILEGLETIPELNTRSDANGIFTFPSLSTHHSQSFGILAKAEVNGKTHLGEHLATQDATPQTLQGNFALYDSSKPIIIQLTPTTTASGRVVDGLTAKPMANVSVQMETPTLKKYTSVVTDEKGEFRFENIPSVRYRSLTVRASGFPKATIPLDWHTSPQGQPKSYSGLTIKMRPAVNVHVTLKDAETGQPPTIPLGLTAFLAEEKNALNADGEQQRYESRNDNAIPAADGRFWMKMPVGMNCIELSARGSEKDAYEIVNKPKVDKHNRYEVREDGTHVLIIKVRRKPGLLLKLQMPGREYFHNTTAWVRYNDTAEKSYHLDTGYVFIENYQRGDKVSIRVTETTEAQSNQEILASTEIAVDPKNWPHIVQLPQ